MYFLYSIFRAKFWKKWIGVCKLLSINEIKINLFFMRDFWHDLTWKSETESETSVSLLRQGCLSGCLSWDGWIS